MAKKEQNQENMSVEEARAFRAAKHAALPKKATEEEKREAFRVFWAQEKSNYGKDKKLEPFLWLHLQSMKMDTPDKFKAGLKHFGLQEVKK